MLIHRIVDITQCSLTLHFDFRIEPASLSRVTVSCEDNALQKKKILIKK